MLEKVTATAMRIKQLEESMCVAKEELRKILYTSEWLKQFENGYKEKAVESAIRVITEKIPVEVKYDSLFSQYMVVATNYIYLGEYLTDAEAKKACELFSC